MQEHGRQNCDPVMTGNDVRGDDRPFQDERIPLHQFGYKRSHIDDNDQCRDNGEMSGASRCVR